MSFLFLLSAAASAAPGAGAKPNYESCVRAYEAGAAQKDGGDRTAAAAGAGAKPDCPPPVLDRKLEAFARAGLATVGEAHRKVDWHTGTPVVSAWPMSEKRRTQFGVDVNGVWTWHDQKDIARIHEQGGVALSSLQIMAGKKGFMAEHPELKGAASRDIFGRTARVGWYTWEKELPVALSINNPAFQRYVRKTAVDAIEMGTDSIFLDEVQTSAFLISTYPEGAGFGPDDMRVYEADLRAKGFESFAKYVASRFPESKPAARDTRDIAAFLRAKDARLKVAQDALFGEYKHFQEKEAYRVMSRLVRAIRGEAACRGRSVSIGVNVAGKGSMTNWSAISDYIVFEHHMTDLKDDKRFLRMPEGSFVADYKLGKAIVPGMVAAFPSGDFVKSLRQGKHENYLALMYAEALAAEGNWAIGYWWQDYGWPEDTLNPDSLARYTRFAKEHRALFEGRREKNKVAVVYSNQGALADGDRHDSFVGLCQALTEMNVQYDVIFAGDDRFSASPLSPADLAPYSLVLLPTANSLTKDQLAALRGVPAPGAKRNLVTFGNVDPALADAPGLIRSPDHGHAYREGDRGRAREQLAALLATTHPAPERAVRSVSDREVAVTAYRRGSTSVLHFVNRAYDAKGDVLPKKKDISVEIAAPAGLGPASKLRYLVPGQPAVELNFVRAGDTVRFTLPSLEVYGVVELAGA